MHVEYDEPFYLRADEFRRVLLADVPAELQWAKDMFVLNCALGCRIGDLKKLSKALRRLQLIGPSACTTRRLGTMCIGPYTRWRPPNWPAKPTWICSIRCRSTTTPRGCIERGLRPCSGRRSTGCDLCLSSGLIKFTCWWPDFAGLVEKVGGLSLLLSA